MSRIAVIGAGLIGRAWCIVFARAGHDVRLYDVDAEALARAKIRVDSAAKDLERAGLLDRADQIPEHIEIFDDLGRALEGVVYVQECGPEKLDLKREVFADLDRLAPKDAILASSSSGIVASAFTEGLDGAWRCMVAHPANPPYLIPFVEICPSSSTDDEVVERAYKLLADADQVPILVNKEVRGFVLNRLQGALLNEAMRLYEDGVASAEDIDKTVRQGLGLRWSFIGPFETIDLNAPHGLREYALRYGPMYEKLGEEQADARPWREETIDQLHEERRRVLPAESLSDRQDWRDRRLMALMAHKRKASGEIGD